MRVPLCATSVVDCVRYHRATVALEEGSSGTHCLRSISKSIKYEVLASSTMKLATCFIQVPYKGSRYSKKKLESIKD